MNKSTKKVTRSGFLYRLFRAYMLFFHDKIFYRHTYRLNTETIPPDGTPLMIVSNHQNCLNDPLGILFTIRDRKPSFITRADIFAYHPLANKFLRAIGLLPAFRINYEGEDTLSKNKETFHVTEQELINGRTIVMYPEAGHQDKRWLGQFSFGYTRLAFEAAALNNFETDILILPACNHYSDYSPIQEQILIKFGTPISLFPYYELYKTNPRTAQRQVNTLVHEQICHLMLHIEDLDNYQAIDFLRNTYGERYAQVNGYDPAYLPDRLLSDKILVANLEQAKAIDREGLLKIYQQTLQLEKAIKKRKINDRLFDKVPSWSRIILQFILCILLFPLWVFSLWPNALHLIIPTILRNRVTDKMFYGTFLFSSSILITIPLFYILTGVLTYIYISVWIALIYLALLPLLGLLAWYYRKFFIKTCQAFRFRKEINNTTIKKLKDLRTSIYNKLDSLLQQL